MLAVYSCHIHLKCPVQEAKLERQICPAAGPQRHLLSWNAVLSSEGAMGSGFACSVHKGVDLPAKSIRSDALTQEQVGGRVMSPKEKTT